MQYKAFNGTYMLRVDRGEEILQSLKVPCEKEM